MAQEEYRSIADEGLETLKSETPKDEVELKKISLDTSEG